jgi:hypothetical protein
LKEGFELRSRAFRVRFGIRPEFARRKLKKPAGKSRGQPRLSFRARYRRAVAGASFAEGGAAEKGAAAHPGSMSGVTPLYLYLY